MKVKGKDVLVWLNGAVIACSTNCALEIDCEMREIAGKMSARAREFIPGKYSWSISVDALVAAENAQFANVVSLLKNGTKVSVSFAVANEGLPFEGFSGSAFVSSAGENAPLDSFESLKISFQGTGELLEIR